VRLKHLIAEANGVLKHKQRAMHTSAIKFITYKYTHYIAATTSKWMTSTSKARLLGFGAFKAQLKQDSTS
jgi:hypothetical protein